MCVPVDNHVALVCSKQRGRRRDPELVTMADMDQQTARFNRQRGGQAGVIHGIGVAMNRHYWCDDPKLVQNVVAPDVTGMKNQPDALQRLVHLGSQQSVRVRNQSYGITGRRFAHQSYISR